MTNPTKLALAKLILSEEPATPGVMHAIALIEAAMPRSGTPEYRAAFAMAHGIRKGERV